jgi:predicted phosphatase
MEENRTVVVDIDGVLAVPRSDLDYGKCMVMPGAICALKGMRRDGYFVVLATARHIDKAIPTLAWLDAHGIEYDHIQFGKPPAMAYIDDRAIRFTSWDQTMADLKAL